MLLSKEFFKNPYEGFGSIYTLLLHPADYQINIIGTREEIGEHQSAVANLLLLSSLSQESCLMRFLYKGFATTSAICVVRATLEDGQQVNYQC